MRSEEEVLKAIDRYADTVRRICMIHLKNYAATEGLHQGNGKHYGYGKNKNNN